MNIWYFNHYAGGPGFGKYLRSFHLAKHWAKMGHRCTVFVARYHHLLSEPLPPRIDADGVTYISLPARRYDGNGFGRFLNILDFCFSMPATVKQVAEFGVPDAIIHSSAPPMGIFPAWHLARRFRAKLVFEVRDLWPLSLTEIAGTSHLHPLALASAASERFAYRHSHLCASLLGNAETYMRSRGLRGDFVHVPNGYEVSPAQEPTTVPGREAMSLIEKWQSEGRTVIIHPGAQGVPNALDVLVKACQRIAPDERQKFSVLLLGSGSQTERLKAMASDLPNLAFFPNVPKHEAVYLTGCCDVGYAGAKDHREVYKHGISFNKITDFLGAGLPTIVPFYTRSDPVSESGCGIVTDSDDPAVVAKAIRLLCSMTPADRRDMGRKGKEFAETRLAYAAVAERYLNAIASASCGLR